MINRELIRIKVVQLVYAYYQNEGVDMSTAEKELLFSLDKAYELYNNMLLLIVAITKEETNRVKVLSQRAQREGESLPTRKFIDNKFAAQLAANAQLAEFTEKGMAIWDDYIDLVRRLCTLIEDSEVYREYIQAKGSSYEADRELWRVLYKQLLQDNSDIDEVLEEKSLYWNDDKATIDTFVLKTIRRFSEAEGSHQELLPAFKDEGDRDFARRLFHATIVSGNEYRRYMDQASDNWQLDRLAMMDVVIMQIAIAEMLTFASIPVNVTISEYIELAKIYSTPRSASYINGVLDNVAHYLVEQGLMFKTVRENAPKDATSADSTTPSTEKSEK